MVDSILYVRLPCPKIYPVSVVYLADFIHKEFGNIKQEILDLSLVKPEDEEKTLLKKIEEFNPKIIAFSWRVIQPFSPDESDPSLINAFNFYYSKNPITKLKSASFGLKSILAYKNRTKKSLDLIEAAHECFADKQIVIGGPAFSIFWEFIMPKCPDNTIGIIGEGENALAKIIKNTDLKGERVAIKKDDVIEVWQQKELVAIERHTAIDFDYIASVFPGFSQYIDGYVSIPTKRGCPFSCTFCLYNYIEGKKVRYRNPDVVAAEIEHLNKKYGVRKIWFCDSQFLPLPKDFNKCEQILDAIIEKDLDVEWTSYIRLENLNKTLAKKMVVSGLSDFELSINSGSQQVINQLKLGFKIEKLLEACKILKSAGYNEKIRLNFSLNAPGETKETLLETINIVKEISAIFGEDKIEPFIFFLGIQPKTGLAKYAIEQKMLPKKWNPLELNPFIIKKLIYNPPPLGKLIGKAVIEAAKSKESIGAKTLSILEENLR